MNSSPCPVYRFGPFSLDVARRCLHRDGTLIPLTPKAFDLLLVLVRRSGLTVQKEALLKEVWPDAFVEEGNLTVHMSSLRKALGDDSEEPQYIETVPRQGYRFCVPVEVTTEAPRALVIERHRETRIVREEIEEGVAASPLPWKPLAIGAVGLLVVVAGVAAWQWARLASPAAPATAAPLRVTTFASFPNGVMTPAFAPDGERIAFAWTGPQDKDWSIYVKTIGADPPLKLTANPANDTCPAWSPGGRTIAFLRGDLAARTMAIYTIGALGGREQKLLDLASNRYFDLDWSPTAPLLAFAEKTDLRRPWDNFRSLAVFLYNLETRQKRQLSFPDEASGDDRFAFSPDGRQLAFVRHSDNQMPTASSIWVVPVEGGTAALVYQEPGWIGHVAWAADGQSLLFSSVREGGSKLFRVDARGAAVEPLPFGASADYYPAISARTGRLAFVQLQENEDLIRFSLHAGSKENSGKPLAATARRESSPDISPDGRRLAFFAEGSGRMELWMSGADGLDPVALTDFHATGPSPPRWSPDGREIAFESEIGPDGTGGVFILDVETRAVRRLTGLRFGYPAWSSDGRTVYLTHSPQRGVYEVWKIPAAGGEAVRVLPEGHLVAQESPDGATLYFTRHAGGIWSMPVAGGPAKEVVPQFSTVARGYWRVVKTGIYYVTLGQDGTASIEFLSFATRRSTPVLQVPVTILEYQSGLAVSPDERWLVIAQRPSYSASDLMLVENFR